MLYFVQTFNTYSPKNRACKKLIDFVQKFERVLIKDELSLDTLKEEIRIKVDEINAEHPKLKKLRFSAGNITGGMQRIDATVDNMGCPDYVFFMDICRIRSIYQFSERIDAGEKEIVIRRTVCADSRIKDDPATEQCINSKRIP